MAKLRSMSILSEKNCRVEPGPEDGTRILVMRFWPRGVPKARFDDWYRHLAPSPRLLGKFRETVADKSLPEQVRDEAWRQFAAAYRSEMSEQRPAIAELRQRHEAGETLTLLCGCHDPARCHRTLLADLVLVGPDGNG